MFQDDEIDKIYEEEFKKPIYSTYLKKGFKNKCKVFFSTTQVVDDKKFNRGVNFQIEISPIDMSYGMESFDEDQTCYLIAPKITFCKMFKKAGIDIRKLINEKKIYVITFKRHSRRMYELVEAKHLTIF